MILHRHTNLRPIIAALMLISSYGIAETTSLEESPVDGIIEITQTDVSGTIDHHFINAIQVIRVYSKGNFEYRAVDRSSTSVIITTTEPKPPPEAPNQSGIYIKPPRIRT